MNSNGDSDSGANEEKNRVLEEKVSPIIEKAMHQHLGVTVKEVKKDITDILSKPKLFMLPIGFDQPFKTAKKNFKKEYLRKILRENGGNVSKCAKIAGVDRRTIHRLLSEFSLNPEEFRSETRHQDYSRELKVQNIIEKTLEHYKEFLHPSKVQQFYQEAPNISKQIIKEMPLEEQLTMSKAERIFEKEYFETNLESNNWNVRKTAGSIGIAEETLHRKIKDIGLTRK
ncbi:hypothetical protein HY483_03445 [Candidatus Woesearchaeota archaeon]|nr:hypothetical protein [Candidatus Woesearchaeota archaeon]